MTIRTWLFALIIFLLIASSRLLWLSLFATDLPYWDQWDAEGWGLYRPYQLDTLQWGQLFADHNEHRIFWPRLTSLFLFIASGHEWNNLVSAAFSSIFFAATLAATATVFGRGLKQRELFVLGVLLVVMACLPLGWENLISGFQIAFFWMLLFALSTLALATTAGSYTAIATLAMLALAGLLTIASAMLTPIAAATIIVIRWRCRDIANGPAAMALAALALVALFGYWLLPSFHAHDGLKAQDATDFMAALGAVLAWPFPGWQAFGWLLWTPLLLWVPALIRGRSMPKRTLFALGVSGWILMQCVAIAASRGHALLIVPHRYVDLLMLAPLSNVYLCLAWLREREAARRSRLESVGASALIVLALAGLLTVGFHAVGSLGERHALAQIQMRHVRDYVQAGDTTALNGRPYGHIPYPDAARLKMMLDDPIIRDMLPASIASATPTAVATKAPRLTRVTHALLDSSGWLLALISLIAGIGVTHRWLASTRERHEIESATVRREI